MQEEMIINTCKVANVHPDVAKVTFRYGRIHHVVNYSKFKNNPLIKKKVDDSKPKVNNYGLELKLE